MLSLSVTLNGCVPFDEVTHGLSNKPFEMREYISHDVFSSSTEIQLFLAACSEFI